MRPLGRSILISLIAVALVVAGARAQTTRIRVCVLDGPQLREVETDYDSMTGDTTVAGKPFSSVYPATGGYAGDAAWYIDNDPIQVGDTRYVKHGLPRVLGVLEVERFGEYAGVAAFAEAGARNAPEVIYLPVRIGCEFQPYQTAITEGNVRDPGPRSAATPIVPPQVVSGVLDASDPADVDNAHFDDYAFTGRAGDTVIVEMRALEMDAYLTVGRLYDGEFVELDSNDDGFDSGTDSRLVLVLPEDDEYVVRASTLFGGEVGSYTLSIQPAGDPPGGAGAPSIGVGQSLSGRLETSDPQLADESYYDDYALVLRSGQRVVITLRSKDFDTYLIIGWRSADGAFNSLDTNDDGLGMGTDSRIEMSFDAAGEYIVRANSYRGQETGEYTLSVESP